MRHTILTTLALSLLATSACSFYARDAETYRADTRTVLEQKQTDIDACYKDALAKDPTLEGETVVNFTVEKKTGKFINAGLDPSSSAPEELSACIVTALDGLALDPVDQRDGNATFTWRFSAS